jgi:hypothetical protein
MQLNKFDPNENASSPLFISMNKEMTPLPCLTPRVIKRVSSNSGRHSENPFMHKVRIHHNYDKRDSFKLRSANPSQSRYKDMMYAKTQISPNKDDSLEPKFLFKPLPNSLKSIDHKMINKSNPDTSKS